MLFLNKQELLHNTSSGKLQVLRTDAIDILEKAVAAVEPKKALKKVSSRSERDEIAAVPTVLNAHALPNTVTLRDIAAENANAAAV